MDDVVNRFTRHNLDSWKGVDLNPQALERVINKYRFGVAKINIRKGMVILDKKFNNCHEKYLNRSLKFLSDVSKMYEDIDTTIYLYARDTLQYDNINIYNVNGTLGNPKGLDDFVWGVSKTDKDYIRIVDSYDIPEYNKTFPLFCFERNRKMNGILFPGFDADDNNYMLSKNIDEYSFSEKDKDRVVFRGFNVCTDVNHLDKIDMMKMSYDNPDKYDFKMSSMRMHPIWGKHIVSRSLLKFWNNTRGLSTDIDLFRDYFSIDNFMSYNDIFRHRYIATVGSAKNNKWYLSNSVVIEYKFKNKEFFHEILFRDMDSIVYFDNRENIEDKIDRLSKDDYRLAKDNIRKRKELYMKYIHYPNLIKWYGLFLLEYGNKIKV